MLRGAAVLVCAARRRRYAVQVLLVLCLAERHVDAARISLFSTF